MYQSISTNFAALMKFLFDTGVPVSHMHFAFILRHRRRLLMQLDPTKSPISLPSSSLKRPYSQQAFGLKPRPRSPPSSISSAAPERSSPPRRFSPLPSRTDNYNQRPTKAPKLRGTQSPSQSTALPNSADRMSYPSRETRNPGDSSEWRSGKSSVFSGRGSRSKQSASRHTRGKGHQKSRAYPEISGPLHDSQYIQATYMSKPLRADYTQGPKSPLSNHLINVLGISPVYEYTQLSTQDGQTIWRCINCSFLSLLD